MTTANLPTGITNHPAPNQLLSTFVERVVSERTIFRPKPAEPKTIPWVSSTLEGIQALPSMEENMPDGRKPTRPEAVANLLLLFMSILDEKTAPPTSINSSWRGGVTAEWHINGFDLEIRSDPDGSITYAFANPEGEEMEGIVENSTDKLRRYVRMLPAAIT